MIVDQVSALVISCALALAGAASRPLATRSSSAPAPLAGKVVTIDPGHNGGNFNDPTAINRLVNDGNGLKACDTTGTAAPDGYRETDFNWYVALDLRLALIHEGATVVLTRHSNTGVGPCITQRAAIGNRAHSNVALSIHADGGPPSGSGFAILTPASIPSGLNRRIIGPSSRFAIDLRSGLERIGHLNPSNYDGVNGIAPRTDLGGLNLSLVPKVFVEVGNMQNPADEAPMETSRYRRRVAAALAAAITQFLAG
ncbi:MAG: N-acetylmuramoyl-L-alanine amidase [Solirubrobacteraceae bacterium]